MDTGLIIGLVVCGVAFVGLLATWIIFSRKTKNIRHKKDENEQKGEN